MVPFTFYYDFDDVDSRRRQMIFNEFAACGVQNLVLSDGLIKQIAQERSLHREIKKQLEISGIKFVDAHAPFGPDIDLLTPPDERDLMLARQMFTLEVVHNFGVDTCCFHLGNPPFYLEYKLEELHDFICMNLEVLLKRAEQLGITICIENVFKPLNTVSEIKRLLEIFDTPYLGVCYDSGHANIMEKGMDFPDSRPWGSWEGRGDVEWEHNVLEELLPHIVNCHLHDNHGSQDEHLPPGEGNYDWAKNLPLLKSAPRLRCIQSEVSFLRHNLAIRPQVDLWAKYMA